MENKLFTIDTHSSMCKTDIFLAKFKEKTMYIQNLCKTQL